MAEIVWTDEAEQWLLKIYDYIAKDSPAAAFNVVLLELRRLHPTWGAKKLLKVLQRRRPKWALPARSTACDLLRRAGLVPAQRRRRKLGHPGRPMSTMEEPNAVWTADFKGEFKPAMGTTATR